MIGFIGRSVIYPRWLVGMAAAVSLHAAIWQFPPISANLLAHVATPATFAALLCTLTVGLTSIAVLRRWPDRLSVVFPMLTPVWILFSTGYVEYYPLVVGAWVAILAWMFERPLADRSPIVLGGIIGLLPLLYVGFAPLSVLASVLYTVFRPSKTMTLVGAAAGTFVLTIAVCSPGLPQFFSSLYAEMNFGEQHTGFLRYIGRSAGPNSIFFSARYVFARSHLRDLYYMYFWSGGWLFVPLLVAAAVAAVRQRAWLRAAYDARTWLAVLLLVWQVYYVLFMIPKMGPTVDVDLFWPTYIVLAFFAGHLIDTLGLRSEWRYSIVCALAGTTVSTAVFLAWITLPLRL